MVRSYQIDKLQQFNTVFILEYDLGGMKGRRKYYVFADGLRKDGMVSTNKEIVEESMNNSTLSKSTIKSRKEQFGWDTPR